MKKIILLSALLYSFSGLNGQTHFTENFDSGIPPAWTITDNLNDGFTWFGTLGGYDSLGVDFLDGTEFAMVDSDRDGNGIKMIEDLTTPAFNPGAPALLLLEFDQYYRDILAGDSGVVEVFDGTVWQPVVAFTGPDYGAWGSLDHQVIDITAHANPAMQVRFHYDDNNQWALFWAIDNVKIWTPPTDDVSLSAILAPGSGRTLTGSALGATESIQIEVTNNGAVVASNIPVSYRMNGGTPVNEVLPGPINPGLSATFSFTVTQDLSGPGVYVFDAWTALPVDGNLSNDSLFGYKAIHVPNPVMTLPYCQDFEMAVDTAIQTAVISIPGVNELDYENTFANCRMRTLAGPGFPQSGVMAITLDQIPDGFDESNFLILTWNMSSFSTSDSVLLDFSIMDHGDENDANDFVWVRGDDASPWIAITDWNALTGGTTGQYFSVNDFDLSNTLATAGQAYSTSTQFRLGQQDNFPAISPTASDGVSLDDVKLRIILPEDIAVEAVLSPMNFECGDSLAELCIIIRNAGINPLSNISVNADVSGAGVANFSTTYTGTLNINESDTVCFSPFNTIGGGVFNIKAFASVGGDANQDNDTLWFDVNTVGLQTAVGIDDTVTCPGDSALLTVVNNPSILSYDWFTSDTASMPFASGDSAWTGPVANDTTFWASALAARVLSVGKPDNSGSGGDYNTYTDGLVFDALSDFIIDSVVVYPGIAGNVVVVVEDAIGTQIGSVTVAVSPSVSGERTVIPVGISIAPGVGYEINAVGSNTGLFRNNGGVVYPILDNLGGTTAQITGPINGLAGYYYFFYDWIISTPGCPGPRVPVNVVVDPNIPAVISGFTYSDNLLTFDFTDVSTGADMWEWDFGDGNSSTMQNPQHTYANDTLVTVCQIASNVCYSDTSCQMLTACGQIPAFSWVRNGLMVTFTDGTNGNPTSWTWNFGDLGMGTIQNPIHSYTTDGNYNVCMLVDNGLCTDSICDSVAACAPMAGSWSFNVSGLGLSYDFTDMSTGSPTSWMWDFGDLNTSTMQNPQHTYAMDGNYTVSLIVTNLCGDTSSMSMPLIVTHNYNSISGSEISLYPNPSSGLFTLETSGLNGLTVNIRVSNLLGQVVFDEDFDGTGSALKTKIDLTGFAKGSYIVHLRSGGQRQVSKIIIR